MHTVDMQATHQEEDQIFLSALKRLGNVLTTVNAAEILAMALTGCTASSTQRDLTATSKGEI